MRFILSGYLGNGHCRSGTRRLYTLHSTLAGDILTCQRLPDWISLLQGAAAPSGTLMAKPHCPPQDPRVGLTHQPGSIHCCVSASVKKDADVVSQASPGKHAGSHMAELHNFFYKRDKCTTSSSQLSWCCLTTAGP